MVLGHGIAGSQPSDLFFLRDGKGHGIRFKYADTPTVTRSMRNAMDLLGLERLWIVYPGPSRFFLAE